MHGKIQITGISESRARGSQAPVCEHSEVEEATGSANACGAVAGSQAGAGGFYQKRALGIGERGEQIRQKGTEA